MEAAVVAGVDAAGAPNPPKAGVEVAGAPKAGGAAEVVDAPKAVLAAPPKLKEDPPVGAAAGTAALDAAGAPKLKLLPVEAAGAPKAGVDAAGGAPKLKPVGAAVLAAGAPNAGGAAVFGAEMWIQGELLTSISISHIFRK